MYDSRDRRLYERLNINGVYGELMDGADEVMCRIDNISEDGIGIVLEEPLKKYPHRDSYILVFYDEEVNTEDYYTILDINVVHKIGNKLGCKVDSNLKSYEDYVMKKKVVEFIRTNRGEKYKNAI